MILNSNGDVDPAAGVPFGVDVFAVDADGNIDLTYNGSVSINMAGDSGNNGLGGVLTANAIGGVAAFTDLIFNNQGTGYLLDATVDGLTTGASPAFDVEPYQLVVTTAPQSIASGNNLELIVKAEDLAGNIDTSFNGNVSVNLSDYLGSNVSVSGTLTVPAINGVATFSDLSVSQIGDFAFSLTSSGLAGTSAPLNVVTVGDFNQDGHVDAGDIMPAMQALTNPTGYEAQYGVSPAELPAIGDVNGDGHFNNADLQALLNLLIGGGGSTSTDGNGGSGSLSSESQGSATNTTGTPEATTSSPAIAPLITSSTTDGSATIAPAASVIVTTGNASASVAPPPVDPLVATVADPISPSVTAYTTPAAPDPARVQLMSQVDPTTLPASDADAATTSPINESVATTNLPEAGLESLFVGALETLGPDNPSSTEKPVSSSPSQNMTSPWPQHLLPGAVDQVLLTPELDRSRPLRWHSEKQVDDDAFADDSVADLFAQWSQWQA